jgi:hypothetical protein
MATTLPTAIHKRTSVRIGIAVAAIAITAGLTAADIWKPFAKRHLKWVVIATNMYQNTLRRSHIRSDQIGGTAAAFSEEDLDSAVRAIDATFDAYLQHARLQYVYGKGSPMSSGARRESAIACTIPA